MKNIVLIYLLILSCFIAGIAGADNNLAANFPAKALVFLQADNMTGVIDSYLKSDFGRKYLQTASFKDFSRSKLYLKLSDRFDSWEKLTAFDIDIRNIRQFAGGESAVAVYDIGKISVLFMSKVTYAQASKSRLFRLRDKFDVA